MTIAISMLISAFNALTLSPALAALLLRPRKESRGLLGRFFGGFNRGFEKVMHGYVNWSHALIRKAVIAVVILVGFTLVDGVVGSRLPTSFLPAEDYGYAFLNVQLPQAASLERTDEVLKKIEAILAKTEGVQYYTTIGGFSLLNRISASYQGFFFLGFKPWDERTSEGLQAQEIVNTVNGALAAQSAGGHRLCLSAARDSGTRQRGRFLALAAGPQRRLGRVSRSEPAKVPRRRRQTAGAGGSHLALFGLGPANLRRRGSRQGSEAGRGDGRRVPNACKPISAGSI